MRAVAKGCGIWAAMGSALGAPHAKDVVLASVALALFYVWEVVHFQTFPFDAGSVVLLRTVSYQSLCALFSAVALLVMFVLYWRRRAVPRGVPYFAGIGLTLGLGYLMGECVLLMPAHEAAAVAAFVVHAACLSAAPAFWALELFRLLGKMGTRRSMAVVIGGSLGAALLAAAVGSLGAPWVRPVGLAMALGSVCITALLLVPSPEAYDHGADAELNVPYRMLATVLVSDLCCGMVVAWAQGLGAHDVVATGGVACFGSAALMLAVGFWLRMDFNNLIYRVAFAVMAVGAAVLAAGAGNAVAAGLGLHQVGYRFMLALTWLLSAWLINNRGLSANWVYPTVTCAAFVGTFTGEWVYGAVLVAAGAADAARMVCVAAAVLLPLCALYLLGAHNLQSGWGFCQPAQPDAGTEDRVALACERLSGGYGLTRREAQLFEMLARGYTRKEVGEVLVLAPDTVKSYANRMYTKVGVHSRQELAALVERAVADLGADRPGA